MSLSSKNTLLILDRNTGKIISTHKTVKSQKAAFRKLVKEGREVVYGYYQYVGLVSKY